MGPWCDQREALLRYIAQRNWVGVIKMYKKYPETHGVQIETGDTAIHVAVSDQQSEVEEMVHVVRSDVLKIVNNQGNTPLHLAASLGSTDICRCIAEKDKDSNIPSSRNQNGETPIFLAVANGNIDAFFYLRGYCKNEEDEYAYFGRNNGDTILHAAVSGKHFDIAYCIIYQYPKLVYMVNNKGESPLHLLAAMPAAFESGNPLIGLSKLIYHCITVGKLEQLLPHIVKVRNQNPRSPRDAILVEDRGKEHQEEKDAASKKVGNWKNSQHDEEAANVQVTAATSSSSVAFSSSSRQHPFQFIERLAGKIWTVVLSLLLPIVLPCIIVYWLIKFIWSLVMAVFKFVTGYELYVSLRRLKERCTWSVEVMNKLIEYEHKEWGVSPQPDAHQDLAGTSRVVATTKMETPLFIAAKHGVVEMVERILDVRPDAIFDVSTQGKNIVMLAAENRHPHVYEFLLQKPRTIFQMTDNQGNSVLHLAAKLEQDRRPWRIRGAPLEMYMEVKWYKFVKHSMPLGFFVRYKNLNGETPGEIFKSAHQDLVDESRQFLTNYSNSASLVSALIATVVYPTSATVPGGLRQDNGAPVLEDNALFIISAISSLIGLCSSMIALVMFMVIPTSTFRVRDFHKSLPLKLLVGLISLFISILSMLVSFCTGQFFVLKDKLGNGAIPMYALLCLPLVVFISAQFLLDCETVWITLKKQPRRQQRK